MAMWNRTNIIVVVIMVIAQIILGLVTLIHKYLAEKGDMPMRIVVAYRMVLAAVLYPPSIYIMERNLSRSTPRGRSPAESSLTFTVLGQAIMCSFFGRVVSYNLSVVASANASATFVASISNLLPAVTFIMAIILRRESFNVYTWAGRAKVLGTIIAISGAMISSFYKGRVLEFGLPQMNMNKDTPFYKLFGPRKRHEYLGILAAVGSCISSAASIIIEGILLKTYPNLLRATGLIVGLGAIQCVIYAFIMDSTPSEWRFDGELGVNILYMIIAAFVVFMILTTWCINKKGSFFISTFNGISLIVVVLVGPFVLHDPLHVGSLIGAIVILLGSYLVIWGKKDDNKENLPARENDGV